MPATVPQIRFLSMPFSKDVRDRQPPRDRRRPEHGPGARRSRGLAERAWYGRLTIANAFEKRDETPTRSLEHPVERNSYSRRVAPHASGSTTRRIWANSH